MLCVGGTFIVSVVSFYSTYRSFMNSTEGVDRLAIVLMLWSNLFQFMVVVLIAACSTTTREVSHYLHGGILQYICKTSLSNREHTQLCWFIRLSINANILILCRRLYFWTVISFFKYAVDKKLVSTHLFSWHVSHNSYNIVSQ